MHTNEKGKHDLGPVVKPRDDKSFIDPIPAYAGMTRVFKVLNLCGFLTILCHSGAGPRNPGVCK